MESNPASGATSTAADARVRALEENCWSMWSLFGRGPACSLIDTPTTLAYQTPILHPPYNAVMRFIVGENEADSAMDELISPYRERGVPVTWLVHPTTRPADLRERLAARGLVRAEVITGMVAALDDVPPPLPPAPGIEVFEGKRDEVEDWMRLVSWRYDLPRDASDMLESLYAVAIGQSGPDRVTRWWGARKNGATISKTVLHVGAGVAGIYGVATLEEGRGLGLACLLTATALHAAREHGCRQAVLHSTPIAVRLYRRLGFDVVADFEVWSDPGQLHL